MRSRDDFLKAYEGHIKNINRELLTNLSCRRIPVIEEIGKHILEGEGKRLRPLLFVLSCHVCNYRGEDIYRIAAIFEYIHVASLLHDDVLDNSELRRKKRSANIIWGNHPAVLGGDFLCALAYNIAVMSNNMAFVKKISETISRLVEGQFGELINSNNFNISKDEYIDIIEGKTARLMSCACACGAIISNARDKDVKQLENFGLNLGIAFQLIDDLLDYISSEDVFGKPVGKDIKEGKITLPLIYAFSWLGESERKRIVSLFAGDEASDEDCRYIIEMVRSSGAVEQVRRDAIHFIDKAERCLESFEDSAAKTALLEMNRYVVHRSS